MFFSEVLRGEIFLNNSLKHVIMKFACFPSKCCYAGVLRLHFELNDCNVQEIGDQLHKALSCKLTILTIKLPISDVLSTFD